MGTIIVLQKGKGYDEDYEVVVDAVYHINKKNFALWFEYGMYQAKFYTEKGVDVFCNDSGDVKFKYPEKSTSNERAKIQRKYWKINREHKKELSIRYYIEEILKAEKVDFTCGFDFER